jgi:hypothetical protein
VTAHFTWHRFAAIQIWIFILFLIYTSIVELNAVLGDGRLGRSSSPGVRRNRFEMSKAINASKKITRIGGGRLKGYARPFLLAQTLLLQEG